MSSMGELTFVLGLQVQQSSSGMYISQDKYVTDILKRFNFTTVKPGSTPVDTNKPLGKDEDGEDVEVKLERGKYKNPRSIVISPGRYVPTRRAKVLNTNL